MYKGIKSVLSILFMLLLCQSAAWSEQSWHILEGPINKNEKDVRQYQVIKLANDMQVLLVYDATAPKSLAGIALPIGSLDDPDKQQGLAHYLEHMVFMGSTHYPEPDGMGEFLSKNAGSYNASTAPNNTSFYLEVDNNAFSVAVDRLSDALAAPLLNPVYADKERNAVNAELTMARARDGMRMAQIESETVNPHHPAAKFFGGNLETLSDKPSSKLHDELLHFYHNYYSSNIMVAVLYSNRPLNELAELANTTLGRISNHNAKVPDIKQPLLTKAEQGVIIHYVPVQPLKLLRIDFNVRNNSDEFRSKADTYLGYMISSRSKNTLADWLLKQDLADSVEVNVSSTTFRCSGTFSIYISLTDKGLQQREQIVNAVFSYLRLIEKQGITSKYFNEVADILSLDFKYQSINRDMSYVSSLASTLLTVPYQYVLNADYVADNYQPEFIRQRLRELTPEVARIWYISPNEPHDKTAYFVNAPYQVKKISQTQLDRWKAGQDAPTLALPVLNPYIPNDFSLIDSKMATKKPLLIVKKPSIRVLYMPSTYFADEPKADITLALRSPLANENARNQVLFALNDYLASLALAELNYQASLAGINFTLSGSNGAAFSADGFTQHLPELLKKLLTEYRDFRPTASQLAQAKSNYLDQLDGAEKVRSFKLAMQPINALSNVPYTERNIRRQLVKDITLDEVNLYRQHILTTSKPEMLIVGNLTEERVKKLADDIVAIVAPQGKSWWHGEDVIINKKIQANLTAEATNTDSALVAMYIPTGYDRIASVARSRLLEQILHSWFFLQLRTEEQLGYVVFASSISVGNQAGLSFIIQSSDKSPNYLYQRYQAFFEQANKRLTSLNDTEFKEYKQGTIRMLQQKPQTLEEEASRFVGDFSRTNYQFDSRHKLIEEINRLQLSDIINFYQQAVIQQQGLSVISQVSSNGKEAEKANYISLPTGWVTYENASTLQQQFPHEVRQ